MNKKIIFVFVGIIMVIFGIYASVSNEQDSPVSANLLASRQLPESAQDYVPLSDDFLAKYPLVHTIIQEEERRFSVIQNSDGVPQLRTLGIPSHIEISVDTAYVLQEALNEYTKTLDDQNISFFVTFNDGYYNIGLDFCTPTCGPYM